jgi:hypothetical protein
MANFIRAYPVTFWFSVGAVAYVWKASLVATAYQKWYAPFEQQRAKEINEIK